MKMKQRVLAVCMAITMLVGMTVSASAAVTASALDAAVADTAAYVGKTVASPQVASIGGEWAVLGLARSGFWNDERYYRDYYATVEKYVTACKGVLHEKKYTEYSRVIVALSAIGKDARSVAGYDLTLPLGDYEKTVWQGINGPIWALLALDSGNYPMPQNSDAKTPATRQMYIDRILECQLPDGGWSLLGGTSSASADVSTPDITGMALQALAKYQTQPAVKQATEKALLCVSKQQSADGGFSDWGEENSESCVQMLVALSELGISPEDSRFVKGGKTLLDNLMSFYVVGKGFRHTVGGTGSNQMATEQGLYGLVAARRLMNGENSLYRMSDALKIGNGTSGDVAAGIGLTGKNPAVLARSIKFPGKTFDDVSGHANQMAIEAMAARGIIAGKSEALFDPNATMTRAEFATMVVRGLGLSPKVSDRFADVPSTAWYAPFVGTAYTYGIVSGTSATTFNPGGTITRQEAAAMLARAAKLCGMDAEYDAATARDVLAQFSDYVQSADWARPALAFCYDCGILDDSVLNIQPKMPVKRGEIAQMIFNMLGLANLL